MDWGGRPIFFTVKGVISRGYFIFNGIIIFLFVLRIIQIARLNPRFSLLSESLDEMKCASQKPHPSPPPPTLPPYRAPYCSYLLRRVPTTHPSNRASKCIIIPVPTQRLCPSTRPATERPHVVPLRACPPPPPRTEWTRRVLTPY